MAFEKIKSFSERTLVPVSLAIAALWGGWWWRDREIAHDEALTKKFTEQMNFDIGMARDAILARIDASTERYVMLDKAQQLGIDADFQSLFELNATLIRPRRFR